MHISGKVRQLFRSTHSRRPKVNSTNTAFPQVNKLIKQLQISNKGSRTYSKGFSHKSPSKWELLNESDYYGADVEDPIVPCPEPKVKKPRNNKSRFTRFMTPTRKCGATFSSDHKSTSLNIHAGLFEGGASWRSPAESNGQALLGTTRTLCENREEKMNHCDEDESRKKIPSKPSLSPTEFPKPKESKENEKKMGKSALISFKKLKKSGKEFGNTMSTGFAGMSKSIYLASLTLPQAYDFQTSEYTDYTRDYVHYID